MNHFIFQAFTVITNIIFSVTAEYSCIPTNYEINIGPRETLPNPLTGIQRLVTTQVPNHHAEDIVYEMQDYAVINKFGILPPLDDYSLISYPIFKFHASTNDTTANATIRNYIIPWVRLPYQFQSGEHIECVIYKVNEVEFFVLDNVFNIGQKYRIDIHKVMVGNEMREFAYIPYRNRQNNELFKRQAWFILLHREEEEEPRKEFGFFHVQQTTAESQKLLVPINAYLTHIHIFPGFTNKQSLKRYDNVTARLSVGWKPSLCYFLAGRGTWFVREECKNGWLIHNFYIDEMINSFFTSTDFEGFVEADFQVERLNEKWRNISPLKTDRQNLIRQWLKHGHHFFRTPLDYFRTTVLLFDSLKMEENTRDLNQKHNPNNLEAYKWNHFRNTVESIFGSGKEMYVNCFVVSDHVSVVYEFHFCFERDRNNQWTRADCSMQGRQETCRHDVFFPDEYKLVPYGFLSLYTLPTLLNFMREHQFYHTFIVTQSNKQEWKQQSQRSKEDERKWFIERADWSRWYIYNFCPSLQYDYLGCDYRTHVDHLLRNFNDSLFDQHRLIWPRLFNEFHLLNYKHCGLRLRLMNNTQLIGFRNYLHAALNLYNRVHASEWSNDHYLKQLDTRLRTSEVLRHINGYVGRNVSLECIRKNNNAYLVQVRVCFDETLTIVDCPRSITIFRASFKNPQFHDCFDDTLWIPSRPHLIF